MTIFASIKRDKRLAVECSWYKYFTDSSYESYSNKNSSNQNFIGNYLISACVFNSIGNDGVIRFDNPGTNSLALHEKCFYTNCTKNSGYGGCFYFNKGCECMQEGITSLNCYSTYNGQFSYVSPIDQKDKRNSLFFSSIDSCSNDKENAGGSSIFNSYGISQISSVNITNCISTITVAFSINYFYKQSYLEFSNIASNTKKSNSNSITFNGGSRDDTAFIISKCCYYNNTETKPGGRVVSLYTINISHCCFANNNLKYTFKVDPGKSIFVTDCYIDKDDKDGSGSLEITNNITDTGQCFFRLGNDESEPEREHCPSVLYKCSSFTVNNKLVILFTATYLGMTLKAI